MLHGCPPITTVGEKDARVRILVPARVSKDEFNPDSAVAIAGKSEEQTFHSEAKFYEVQGFKSSRWGWVVEPLNLQP
jgi:hypothetical protein